MIKIKVFVSWRGCSFKKDARITFKRKIDDLILDSNNKRNDFKIAVFMADMSNSGNTPTLEHLEKAKESEIFVAPLSKNYSNYEDNIESLCVQEFKEFLSLKIYRIQNEDIVKRTIFFAPSIECGVTEKNKIINFLKDNYNEFTNCLSKYKNILRAVNEQDDSSKCEFQNEDFDRDFINDVFTDIVKSAEEYYIKNTGKKYPGLKIADSQTREEIFRSRNADLNKTDGHKDKDWIFIFGPSGVGKSSFLRLVKKVYEPSLSDNLIITPESYGNIYTGIYKTLSGRNKSIPNNKKFKKELNKNINECTYDYQYILIDQLEGFLLTDNINNIIDTIKYINIEFNNTYQIKFKFILSSAINVLESILNNKDIDWKTQQNIINSTVLLPAVSGLEYPEFNNEFYLLKNSIEQLEQKYKKFETALIQHWYWVKSKLDNEDKNNYNYKINNETVNKWNWQASLNHFTELGKAKFNLCQCHIENQEIIKLDLLASLVKRENDIFVRRYRSKADLNSIFKFSHESLEIDNCNKTNIADLLSNSFNFYQGDVRFIKTNESFIYFLHDVIPNAYTDLETHHRDIDKQYQYLNEFEKEYDSCKDQFYGEKLPYTLLEKYERIPDKFESKKIIRTYKRLASILADDYKSKDFKLKVDLFTEALDRVKYEKVFSVVEQELNHLDLKIPRLNSSDDLITCVKRLFDTFYKIKPLLDSKNTSNFYLKCKENLKPSRYLENIIERIDKDMRELFYLFYGIEKTFDLDSITSVSEEKKEKKQTLNCVIAHPDKKIILSACYDSWVRITDIDNEITYKIHQHKDDKEQREAYSCNFSPEGNFGSSRFRGVATTCSIR